MLIKILLVMSFFVSIPLLAIETSQLNLDYLKITKNQILTDIMLELEPKLIIYYRKNNLKETLIKQGVRGVATSFSKDMVYKSVIDSIKASSPKTLTKLINLPKERFPMLWAIGKGEILERELTSSLKLYKALHGNDFEEN